LPSRGLVTSDVMKEEMRREIKNYFNNDITEEKVESFVTTFTSFKKYNDNNKTKGDEVEYRLTES